MSGVAEQDEINELLTHLVTVGGLLMNVQGMSGCCDDTASNAGWMVCNFARHNAARYLLALGQRQ